MKTIIGITGASGIIYGIRFLEKLPDERHLIISNHAKKIIQYETSYKVKDVEKLADFWYENKDLSAPISSGSFKFDSMVIVPCSTSTLSKIANGISDNLITRVAAICLKEKRRLIIVPRETPLSSVYLKNMLTLSENNAIILPAMPGFYHSPKKIDDLVDFIVGKILDCLNVENKLYRRWGE